MCICPFDSLSHVGLSSDVFFLLCARVDLYEFLVLTSLFATCAHHCFLLPPLSLVVGVAADAEDCVDFFFAAQIAPYDF